MENNDLICPICGEPTFVYYGNPRKDRLCSKHGTMLKKGEIEQCEKCSKWKTTGKPCQCESAKENKENKTSNNTEELTCIICGEPSNGKPQCKKCYYETKDFMEMLDKNSTTRKTRDYYYNLKERIFIIKSLEETQKQCNKLIAIAMVGEQYNDDTSLIDRVYRDVETLIKGKLIPQPNDKFDEERKEKDEQKSKIHTALDGHNVDSDMEVRIDDVLFNACILHCYGKSIEEITEKRKKCDWFIPIVNDEGIYIEYWGMKTPKYLEERKEKEELYKLHNIPYIGIEADDPKMDTQTFKTNLIRDITNLAIKEYGFMPRWTRPKK
ncbi:MAG: hypothetical protein II984_01345 [Clostridia bacterium]|nr:hypothetical protein [Clostridia bacterium]